MTVSTATIREKLEKVTQRIERAARSAGRAGGDVRLVVVTKGQPVEVIRAAVEAGARILGENYPEESVPKIQALGRTDAVEWHMIGHLQSRKSALVVDHFDCLQTLDSLHLAERLDRQLAERGRALPVLLEFNVSGEESKAGWPAWDEARWPALLPEIEPLLALRHLSLRGLMTMPPLYDDPEQTRPYFARLRRLRDYLKQQFPGAAWDQLSMGTSADFEAAVQEGATLVRVGTAILGPRPKKVVQGIINQ